MMNRSGTVRYIAVGLATALVTGCSSLGGSFGTADSTDRLVPSEMAQPAPTKTASLPSPPARPEPGRLLGLTTQDVESLLGQPSLVRAERAVQVMQFADAECVLDIFMSEPQPGAQFRTQYVEARDRDGQVLPEEQCLAVLIPQELW